MTSTCSPPSVAVAIPARYASSRLPGKLLLDETGKYLVQHVYENAAACDRVDTVYIATGSDRIAERVRAFDAHVIRTGEHNSGTERLSEAVERMDEDLILNVQGDEPEVGCTELHTLIDLMTDAPWDVGTLSTPIRDRDTLRRPSCVKVVTAPDGRALYFSRAPIPWDASSFSMDKYPYRGDPQASPSLPGNPDGGWQLHIGLYGFTRETLRSWNDLNPGRLEQREGLEQLRALENGLSIGVASVPDGPVGVDTREEYEAFCRRYQS